MTPEVQARALEPFFTTKEIGKGSGLGLAQVFALIEQSGGIIQIESEVGKGTIIRLDLAACDERPNDRAELEREVHSISARRRLLVIDETEASAHVQVEALLGRIEALINYDEPS